MIQTRFALHALFATLAVCLLGLTMVWHIPMMLWDHLDLVPIYQAWQHGTLAESGFLRIHGGHMHTAAYAVLLATTALSGGQTWADCLASWLFLLAYAAIVFAFARETFTTNSRRDMAFSALIVCLALFPGHLANLQWGWQVAVFICLAGVGLTIFALTRHDLSWRHMLVAVPAAALACFSFATAIALFPTALILIALRADCPRARRLTIALPWVAACALTMLQYRGLSASGSPRDIASLALYVLNFLGAGIARFATDLAPWLALAAVASGGWAFARCRWQRQCLPWIGLMSFALLAGILVALGRAAPFGSDHAFVTRYVSFSSVFWLGWTGLIGCACRSAFPSTLRIGVGLVAALAFANGLHMIKKAAHVARQSRVISHSIQATYPQVDRGLLGKIYFNQPDVASQRLEGLHAFGFQPFGRKSARSMPHDP